MHLLCLMSSFVNNLHCEVCTINTVLSRHFKMSEAFQIALRLNCGKVLGCETSSYKISRTNISPLT